MAVININSGGPEGKEREFGLTWSSDLPSVRKPYTRKAHIPEDDVVFGDGESSSGGEVDFTVSQEGVKFTGGGKLNIYLPEMESGESPAEAMLVNATEVTNLAIYIPAELVDTVKVDDNWSAYANVIFPIPEEEETPGEP